MAIVRKVKAVNFNDKQDPELIAKLNAVALHEERKVHTLTQLILLKYLNGQIEKFNIDIYDSQTQPTVG